MQFEDAKDRETFDTYGRNVMFALNNYLMCNEDWDTDEEEEFCQGLYKLHKLFKKKNRLYKIVCNKED